MFYSPIYNILNQALYLCAKAKRCVARKRFMIALRSKLVLRKCCVIEESQPQAPISGVVGRFGMSFTVRGCLAYFPKKKVDNFDLEICVGIRFSLNSVAKQFRFSGRMPPIFA